MAQINLLKQNTGSTDIRHNLPKILNRILIGLLLLVVIFYGYLIWKSSSNEKKATQLQSQMASDLATAMSLKDRNEVLTRQGQLKSYGGVVSAHVYWSQLMPILASSTLQTATYNSLRANPDGSLQLTANVPTLVDLDKYLQVFNQPQYNQYFSNVRIGSYHKVQSNASSGLQFQVQFNFDPSIIKYHGN